MPCNDIKEMLKLYIFYAVCGVGVFGSHLITQILTSSQFPRKKEEEKFEVIAFAKISREPEEAARKLVRRNSFLKDLQRNCVEKFRSVFIVIIFSLFHSVSYQQP